MARVMLDRGCGTFANERSSNRSPGDTGDGVPPMRAATLLCAGCILLATPSHSATIRSASSDEAAMMRLEAISDRTPEQWQSAWRGNGGIGWFKPAGLQRRAGATPPIRRQDYNPAIESLLILLKLNRVRRSPLQANGSRDRPWSCGRANGDVKAARTRQRARFC